MPDLPVLDATEQRVLGSLLEKEVTVPATYPMTVNAVRSACNQASSRDPVVDYDERTVHETLRALKAKDLVAVTWQDSGRRTMKYVQSLVPRLGLGPDQRALLTVLLLRGPQPPGALRSRTERLHPFADRGEVEACLTAMAALEPPLVRELPRGPREQDSRWVHLLGPVEGSGPAGAAPEAAAVDRDVVLAGGAEARDARVRSSYDTVAATYADRLGDELLRDLPFETWLLDRVAAEAAGGPVVEVGCGPGHVTDHLRRAGADATGLDLSPEMVAQARQRHPEGRYEVGDLRRLMRPATAEGWSAVLAWYSLIHLAGSELPDAVAALVRPIVPGGLLVVALHAGGEVRHHDEWWDLPVDLDFVLHERADVVALLESAGLVDLEWYHRGARPDRGETTDRIYVLGRKPR
ncbi:DUF480 domain-containing protein [Nocardioides sp. SYSU D00038]|uniref:DUF480 domain-containing protein n=1 Tax=Nocardioides sp. SYSU D00038 TaxID=2812554 RepID=UPI001967C0CE|nr:DUF480 domain-containing protein [Nocardioides sp. SYSU D00038]